MALADLLALVPPPVVPKVVGSLADWRAVEHTLGLVFPTDYREFIFAYGTGMFATEYAVFNPFAGAKYLDQVRYLCQIEQDMRKQFPSRCPHPIHPEPGGLFPWACCNNGNYYCWLTKGEPDTWQVVTNAVRGEGYREHGCSMSEYLAGVLRGEIKPLIGDFPSPDCFRFDQ